MLLCNKQLLCLQDALCPLLNEGNLLYEHLHITVRFLTIVSAFKIYSGLCNTWKLCFWTAPVGWRLQKILFQQCPLFAESQPLYCCSFVLAHCKILPRCFKSPQHCLLSAWASSVSQPGTMSSSIFLYFASSWVMFVQYKGRVLCAKIIKVAALCFRCFSRLPLAWVPSTPKLSLDRFPDTYHPLWLVVDSCQ